MAPPPGYYTAVMQLPATLVADHDGDEEYSTSTSEEIEVDIEIFKKLSSGHIHIVWMIELALCLLLQTIFTVSSWQCINN